MEAEKLPQGDMQSYKVNRRVAESKMTIPRVNHP